MGEPLGLKLGPVDNVGDPLGIRLGSIESVGTADGLGVPIDGRFDNVGCSLDVEDGCRLGIADGPNDGCSLGIADGPKDGCSLGPEDGCSLGVNDGPEDGCSLGVNDGPEDGCWLGVSEGCVEGGSDGQKGKLLFSQSQAVSRIKGMAALTRAYTPGVWPHVPKLLTPTSVCIPTKLFCRTSGPPESPKHESTPGRPAQSIVSGSRGTNSP